MAVIDKKELRPHQEDVLDKMKNGCILWGGVGTGKSLVAMAYYVLRESPKDVVVITTAKVRDSLHWEGEAAVFGIGSSEDSTVEGVLTVDSWNNIAKYKDLEGCFFIFDEQRLVGKGKWVKTFLKIAKKNHWIMLSATPGDTWSDYIPVFVANGWYKNKTEFEREHIVYRPFRNYPVIDHYIGTSRLLQLRSRILVELKFEKATTRHNETIVVSHDVEMLRRVTKERWNDLENRPIVDASEMFYCMRRVVNSDPSRLQAVRELCKRHPRLIVFYSFNYELEALRTLQNEIPMAEWNGHKHQEIPETEKWLYLVQYVAGSEGWNCVTTNAVCLYSLTYSYKNWEQAHGRIDRLNTEYTDLYYYCLRSRAAIDTAIYRCLQGKRSFQESRVDIKGL
jgi:superfamily II DNA or RNA helicase